MHQYNFTSSNFDEHILDNLYLWNSISDIMQEIAKEEEEKQKRHLRRVVAKQERLKQRPPRLGKHKYDAICLFSFQAHSFSIILVQESWFFYFILPCRYEAAPVQVLLSEEITGSLRQLKVGWLILHIFLFSSIVIFPFKWFMLLHLLVCMKGCCTLVKDRFKSLEKRGLVVPSGKSKRLGLTFTLCLGRLVHLDSGSTH